MRVFQYCNCKICTFLVLRSNSFHLEMGLYYPKKKGYLFWQPKKRKFFFGNQNREDSFLAAKKEKPAFLWCLKKGKSAFFLVSKNCLSMFAQESTVVVNSSTSTPFFITSIGSLLFWTFYAVCFLLLMGLT